MRCLDSDILQLCRTVFLAIGVGLRAVVQSLRVIGYPDQQFRRDLQPGRGLRRQCRRRQPSPAGQCSLDTAVSSGVFGRQGFTVTRHRDR